MNEELSNIIKKLIQSRESHYDHTLKSKDAESLKASLYKFITTAIDKFIAGAQEHSDGDFLTEVDFSRELTAELIDAWIYKSAADYKKLHGL